MAAHAKLSPSAGERWFNCPGSIAQSAGLPRKPGNLYALEGTAAHDLCKVCLERGHDAEYYRGWWAWAKDNGGEGVQQADPRKTLSGLFWAGQIGDEMIEAVQIYLDTCREIEASMVNPVIKVEKRLGITWISPDLFGTGDFVAVEMFGRMVVVDFKYGAGVQVDVEDNIQERIYGVGALGDGNPYHVEEVELVIVQPRAPHSDGPVRSHRMDAEELLAWAGEELRPKAEMALSGTTELNDGPWCRWCPALAASNNVETGEIYKGCPKVQERALTEAGAMFGTDLVPVDPITPMRKIADMTPIQMSQVLKFADLFEEWIKMFRRAAEERLLAGHEIPDWKMVEGRATRKFADEEAALETFMKYAEKEELFTTPKFKTVNQVDEVLKKKGIVGKELRALVDPFVQVTRGRKMVPASDKRPALPLSAEQMFE